MDFTDRYFRLFKFRGFSIRISELSKIRVSPLYRGVGLILLAILFGYHGYRAAKLEAKKDWEKNHAPSDLIWENALILKKLTQLKDSRVHHKAIRMIPGALEQTVWIAPKENWIALASDRIYCRHCKKPPENWQPLPLSWLGFDQALSLLERNPLPEPQPKTKGSPSDPREIRY